MFEEALGNEHSRFFQFYPCQGLGFSRCLRCFRRGGVVAINWVVAALDRQIRIVTGAQQRMDDLRPIGLGISWGDSGVDPSWEATVTRTSFMNRPRPEQALDLAFPGVLLTWERWASMTAPTSFPSAVRQAAAA